MKLNIFYTIISIFLYSSTNAQQPLSLWYDQPAKAWTDALPLGNGSLGAMVYGGVQEDHIQFNEATLWSGQPGDYNRKDAYKYLEPIRKLLNDGNQAAAEQLAQEHFMGRRMNEDAYPKQKKEWISKMRSDTQYASFSFDDSKWKTVVLPTNEGWEKEGWVGLDGSVWFRATFDVDENFNDEQFVINLGKIRDVDFTYINGKLVGTGEGANNIRIYNFNSSLLKKGRNVIAVQVLNFNDKGGFVDKTIKPEYFTISSVISNKTIRLSNTWKYFIQNFKPPAFPAYNAAYLAFADIFFKWTIEGNITGYKRVLELDQALQSVSFTSNNIRYMREYFISYPQQSMAMHFSTDAKSAITLNAVFNTYHSNHTIKKINDSTLGIYLQPSNGVLKAVACLSAKVINGKISVTDTSININKADAVVFYLVAATSFKNYHDVSANPEDSCNKRVSILNQLSYKRIKEQHVKDYQELFNRFSVSFGDKNSDLPTDARIAQPAKADDVALIALYMQYARYLLISSSRPGGQPANLQGIWNNDITPPWGSKYTTNINLEMNYWPADILNLSACMRPFISLTKDVSKTGKTTAKNYYAIDSAWVLHHNTDIWRNTTSVNASNHGIWVTGSGWLATMLWQHFLFTQDTNFLRNEAYPVMKAAARFYDHFLIKDGKTGWLISTPSNSPENGGLVAGPTMDHQIIRELFIDCIKATNVLDTDKTFADSLQQQYKRIAPNQIGKYGQLQEWLQDIDDTSNHHRHVSFLWGVYPGHDITWKDSLMMKAAEQSLLYRGDSGTGWSLAWKINLWARLKDGDHAYKLLQDLLKPAIQNGKETGGTYNNMFDAHPPFQIDGNFGGAAGIAEMLMQSNEEAIELLPALPQALTEGNIAGMRATGNFQLNFSWRNGKLEQVSITSFSGMDCTLKYKQHSIHFPTSKNKTYHFDGDLKAF